MKRRIRLLATIFTMLVMLLAPVVPAPSSPGVAPSLTSFLEPSSAYAATTGQLITRVYTDKARYSPGNTVVITAVLTNTTGASWTGTLALKIERLETSVHTATSSSITLANGASTTRTFNWTAPAGDFTGYYAGITAGVVDFNGTGIDVSSNSLKFPRYGYISDFPTTRTMTDSTSMVNDMSRDYHLNMFQFYDWMYKHEKLLKRTAGVIDSTWLDLFNRTLSWQTIQNDVTAAHNVNASPWPM